MRRRALAGRVAQRESTPFTREGSQVQSLSRPPSQDFELLGTFRSLGSRHADVYMFGEAGGKQKVEIRGNYRLQVPRPPQRRLRRI
jgi:hypothetical protein